MAGVQRWLVAMAVLGVAALALPASVSAHAAYDHSTPARDEVLDVAPAQVDVYFKQEVFKREGANYVRVFDESATQVSAGDGVVDDDDRTHISTALQPDLAPGRYIVQWQSLSDEDGDSDDGAFCFYVAVEPTQAQQDECAAFAPASAQTPEATEPAGATATTPVQTPAVTAAVTPAPTAADTASEDGGDSNTALIVVVVAGIVVAVIVVGGVAVWLRRTLA